jgi:LPS sulfotransferase NodH
MPASRPDHLALIGPEYDQISPVPAQQTLIICSAPRTGSYELCRYLISAGIGVPHEYFNPNYASRLGERWGFERFPLDPSEMGRYVQALRRRRVQNNVFATKVQFTHFDQSLRNEHGRALFEGAIIVHLFRPDAAAQYASYRSALESGVWDFSSRPTTPPVSRDVTDFDSHFRQALQEMDSLMGQDAGFRCMFTLLNVKPLFVTTDDLFNDPRGVVHRIANAMRTAVNEKELDHAIELSASYGRDYKKSTDGMAEHFRRVVFREA